ncbi:MAG: hypothetical protein EXX96DRAFT_519428 [Benjaminiella poitrasii]|nr:MAG: hypothetical protein EXX96DRAFT_519428 [Benjaminiella poitrasii]
MSYIERSRTLCWHLGWLPDGRPQSCLYQPTAHFFRSHAIHCLNMHQRRFLPISIEDPLSFRLNLLSTTKSRQPSEASHWFVRWPIVCTILHELGHLFHRKLSLPGRRFLTWLSYN